MRPEKKKKSFEAERGGERGAKLAQKKYSAGIAQGRKKEGDERGDLGGGIPCLIMRRPGKRQPVFPNQGSNVPGKFF